MSQEQRLPPSGLFGRVDLNAEDKKVKVLGEKKAVNIVNVPPPSTYGSKIVAEEPHLDENLEKPEEGKPFTEKVSEGFTNLGEKIKGVFSREPHPEEEVNKLDKEVDKNLSKTTEKFDKAKKDFESELKDESNKYSAYMEGKAKDAEKKIGEVKDIQCDMDKMKDKSLEKQHQAGEKFKKEADKLGTQFDQGLKKVDDKLSKVQEDIDKNAVQMKDKLGKAQHDLEANLREQTGKVMAQHDTGVRKADETAGKAQMDLNRNVQQMEGKFGSAQQNIAAESKMQADKVASQFNRGVMKTEEKLGDVQKDLDKEIKYQADKVASELGKQQAGQPEKHWNYAPGKFDQSHTGFEKDLDKNKTSTGGNWDQAQRDFDQAQKDTHPYGRAWAQPDDTSINKIEGQFSSAKKDLGQSLHQEPRLGTDVNEAHKDLGTVMKEKIDSVSGKGLSHEQVVRETGGTVLPEAQKGFPGIDNAKKQEPIIGATTSTAPGIRDPHLKYDPDPYLKESTFPGMNIPDPSLASAKHCEVLNAPSGVQKFSGVAKDPNVAIVHPTPPNIPEYDPVMREAFYMDPRMGTEKKEGVLMDTYKVDRARAELEYPGMTKAPAAGVLPKTDLKPGILANIPCPHCTSILDPETIHDVLQKNKDVLTSNVDLRTVALNLHTRCDSCDITLPRETVCTILESCAPKLVGSVKDMKEKPSVLGKGAATSTSGDTAQHASRMPLI